MNRIEELEKEIWMLKRENKALADDNEMKCDEIARLKKLHKQLLHNCEILSEEVSRLEAFLNG